MISPQQAKQISIVQYLAHQGHEVKKMVGGQYFYLSPLREEQKPSFVVKEGGGKDGEDLWHDLGLGGKDGGDIIELVRVWHNYSFPDALKYLADFYNGHNFRVDTKPQQTSSLFDTSNSIKVTAIRPLNHFVLLNYLEKQRGISKPIAKKYLKLVWYETHKASNLFAFGWQNQSGAYELRSAGKKTFKSVTGKKDLTIFRHEGAKDCYVFEGIIDFLSVLEMKNITELKGDVVILNSTTLRKRFLDHLCTKLYDTIYTYFDNDDAGQSTLQYLQDYSLFTFEQQTFYEEFKDVNEWWQNKTMS